MRRLMGRKWLLRALLALPGFRGEAALCTWLFRIALHLCLRWKSSRPATEPWDAETTPLLSDASPSPEAIALLQSADWPGNVRQLRNVLEWLLIMAPGDARTEIGVDSLPPEFVEAATAGRERTIRHAVLGIELFAVSDEIEVVGHASALLGVVGSPSSGDVDGGRGILDRATEGRLVGRTNGDQRERPGDEIDRERLHVVDRDE